MVVWVAVGGRGTLAGAVLGAVVVGAAKSNLSEAFPEIWQYFLGGLFIGSVVLFPAGMVGFLRRWTPRMGGLARGRLDARRSPLAGVPDHTEGRVAAHGE